MITGRCSENLLSAWLDGEVSAEQAARCQEHLATCAHCRDLVQQLQQARALLRSLPPPDVPVDLAQRIRQTVTAELMREQPRALWPAWATPLAAAAALLIVFTVGVMMRAPRLLPPEQVASEPPPAILLPGLPADSDAAAPRTSDPPAGSEPGRAPELALTAASRPQVQPVGRSRAQLAEKPAAVVPMATVATYTLAADTALDPPLTADATLTRAANGEAGEVTVTPRMTPARRELTGATAAPAVSSLELELAGSVVAALVVQDFVEEQLIEGGNTLLSVVTGTPSVELGPRLAEGEDDARFELCFTESMRRALSGRGE